MVYYLKKKGKQVQLKMFFEDTVIIKQVNLVQQQIISTNNVNTQLLKGVGLSSFKIKPCFGDRNTWDRQSVESSTLHESLCGGCKNDIPIMFFQ